jgi:hypothetical protein
LNLPQLKAQVMMQAAAAAAAAVVVVMMCMAVMRYQPAHMYMPIASTPTGIHRILLLLLPL